MKPVNQKAWLLVAPVLLLVAFTAIIPLMTVVNYSVQYVATNAQFHWVGDLWYREVLHSEKFWNALWRNLVFSGIILAIQIPLGVFSRCNDRELLWILIKKTIDELFYQKIGVEESANIDNDMTSQLSLIHI